MKRYILIDVVFLLVILSTIHSTKAACDCACYHWREYDSDGNCLTSDIKYCGADYPPPSIQSGSGKKACSIPGYEPSEDVCIGETDWTACDENEFIGGNPGICKTSGCPGGSDGETCKVYYDYFSGGCKCDRKIGKYDASESQCISCNGEKEDTIWADSSSIIGSYQTGEGKPGDGLCESACGAESECDEKNVDESCGTGKTCSSECKCIVGCVPDTCSDYGYECGTWSDGCGGTIDCGTCGTENCPADYCFDADSDGLDDDLADYPATCDKTCDSSGTCVSCTCTYSVSYDDSSCSVCTRSNPEVTLSPSSHSGEEGTSQTVSYTVTVVNHDTSACGSSTFDLSHSCPSGWTCSLSSNSLTIDAGDSTGTTTLSVTQPSSASSGTYTISSTATNHDHTSYTDTGSADYDISSSGCTEGECDTNNRKYCLSDGSWSSADSTEYCNNCVHCGDGEKNCGEKCEDDDDCGSGESCDSSCQCISECSDDCYEILDDGDDYQDGGEVNYRTGGDCDYDEKADYCSSGTTLVERWCVDENGNMVIDEHGVDYDSEFKDCTDFGSDWYCYDPPSNTQYAYCKSGCVDTDGGDDPLNSGICTDSTGTYSDTCGNKYDITEYYCSGDSCVSKDYNCDDEYTTCYDESGNRIIDMCDEDEDNDRVLNLYVYNYICEDDNDGDYCRKPTSVGSSSTYCGNFWCDQDRECELYGCDEFYSWIQCVYDGWEWTHYPPSSDYESASSDWRYCGDTWDNDCDGSVDCNDPSCDTSPNCFECGSGQRKVRQFYPLGTSTTVDAPSGETFTGGTIVGLYATGDMSWSGDYFNAFVEGNQIDGNYWTGYDDCDYHLVDSNVDITSYISGKSSFDLRIDEHVGDGHCRKVLDVVWCLDLSISASCTPGECDITNRKYCLSDGTWSVQDSTDYCNNCQHCGDDAPNCGEDCDPPGSTQSCTNHGCSGSQTCQSDCTWGTCDAVACQSALGNWYCEGETCCHDEYCAIGSSYCTDCHYDCQDYYTCTASGWTGGPTCSADQCCNNELSGVPDSDCTCSNSGTCSGTKVCSSGNWIDHCGDGNVNCGEECESDADCSGGESCTASCTCNSIVCSSDGECSDGNVCTDDICHNPGTTSSFCSNPNLAAGTDCGDCRECDGSGNCDYLCSGTEDSCECISDSCIDCSDYYGFDCGDKNCLSTELPTSWWCSGGTCVASCEEDSSCISCVPDGCNGNCPSGCTVSEDPDCGCQDGDGCCGIGCDNSNDNDCAQPETCNDLCIANGYVSGTCIDRLACPSGSELLGRGEDYGCGWRVACCCERPPTTTIIQDPCSDVCTSWQGRWCGYPCDWYERRYERNCPDDRPDCSETKCEVYWSCCDDGDGWECGGSNRCGTYTGDDRIYRDYEVSGGRCTSSITDRYPCSCDVSDSDGGVDFLEQGTCTKAEGCAGGNCIDSSSTDSCDDVLTLREYYVSGSDCYSTTKDCTEYGAGYMCLDGKCQYVDCTLTAASITADCAGGEVPGCEPGETVDMTVDWMGDCLNRADFLQVDAISDNGECMVSYTSRISGIWDDNPTLTGIRDGTITGTWTIPTLTVDCLNQLVRPTEAGIYEDGTPADTSPMDTTRDVSGSFTFADGTPYTYEMERGWNLISSPFRSILAVDDDFCSAANKRLYFYNVDSEKWNVRTRGISKMQEGIGYWFYADRQCEVTIIGVGDVVSDDIEIKEGYNHIGSPKDGMDSQKVDSMKDKCKDCGEGGTAGSCSQMEVSAYDPITKRFVKISELGDVMEEGRGYIVECVA